MIKQILRFFLIWIGIVVLPIISAFALPIDDKRFLGLPVILGLGVFVSYFFLAGFLFFYLPLVIFNFPPETKNYQSEQAVQKEILEYFSEANNGNKIFDFVSEGDKTIVTWSSNLAHSQILDIGNYNKKVEFDLIFNKKDYSVLLVQKERDINWNASLHGFSFAFTHFQGIMFDYEAKWKPSFEMADGKIHPQVNKMKYSSMEILGPIQNILSKNGWTLKFGILETMVVPIISLVISILLLISTFALYFLAL